MHNPSSWYDTPLSHLSGGQSRRRAQLSVAEDVTDEGTRPMIDPYLSGLALALELGAGRVPLIP